MAPRNIRRLIFWLMYINLSVGVDDLRDNEELEYLITGPIINVVRADVFTIFQMLRCWLGERAVKYENITIMPPI